MDHAAAGAGPTTKNWALCQNCHCLFLQVPPLLHEPFFFSAYFVFKIIKVDLYLSKGKHAYVFLCFCLCFCLCFFVPFFFVCLFLSFVRFLSSSFFSFLLFPLSFLSFFLSLFEILYFPFFLFYIFFFILYFLLSFFRFSFLFSLFSSLLLFLSFFLSFYLSFFLSLILLLCVIFYVHPFSYQAFRLMRSNRNRPGLKFFAVVHRTQIITRGGANIIELCSYKLQQDAVAIVNEV